jgi:TldD protein
MAQKSSPADKFLKNSGLTLAEVAKTVKEGLKGADFGELYQEIVESESLAKDMGKYIGASVGGGRSGFGFRVGQGPRVGYSYADVFNKAALKDAIQEARQVLKPEEKTPFLTKAARALRDILSTEIFPAEKTSPQNFYPAQNPLEGMTLEQKIAGLDKIEAYARSLDERISNVTLSYNATAQSVHIVTASGKSMTDERPLASLNISITLTGKDGKVETGGINIGGRAVCTDLFEEETWQAAVKQALKLAEDLLIAEEAPAGVMDVVLGNGWNAVILHEAVGHGLEGDFNRKDISVYSGKIGKTIASPEVTVIDQGDMQGERGSVHFDDEGTPGQKNVLIENGVLKRYMQDRQNARLMGVSPTGNGRRQSYMHAPMPRMTNTYFAKGEHTPEEIIASVKDGLYVASMGGGSVDITSGKFNMRATLAYRIRDGKICEPVKGATLVGDGLTVIQSITMVGNDLTLSKSNGSCGKDGQSVTVGCGQPTIRVSNMTVGGTRK